MDYQVPDFSTLLEWEKDARLIKGTLFDAEGAKEREPRTLEEFAEITQRLVQAVWRLQQLAAIKAQEERIAEQIEKGYR